MLLLTYAPLTSCFGSTEDVKNLFRPLDYLMPYVDHEAWELQYRDGKTYGYFELKDAQNDAARGVHYAEQALQTFIIYRAIAALSPRTF